MQPCSDAIVEKLLAQFETAIADCDVVCIEDYNKGAVPAKVCQGVIAAAKKRKIPVLVDPAAVTDYSRYAGATALKLNRPEAAGSQAAGHAIDEPEDFQPVAEKLLKDLDLEAAILTCSTAMGRFSPRKTASDVGSNMPAPGRCSMPPGRGRHGPGDDHRSAGSGR